jgi:5'/3'-nucleotidase
VTRALVTNDDGVESLGIRALAGVGVDAGLDVVVAAPSWDSSGASASLTAVEEDGRFLVDQRRYDELPGVPVFAVEGAPAFIARAGLRGAFGEPPDVVLSGINVGANTGTAVLHSGTVGAVLTASTHGCKGLAVSLDLGGPLHWETAAAFARRALEWLLGAPDVVALNLNVPNLPEDQVAGLARAHLSAAGAVQTTVTELGKGYVKLAYVEGNGHAEPGSDMALLAAGYACVTPLLAPCEASGVDTAGLAAAADQPAGRTR